MRSPESSSNPPAARWGRVVCGGCFLCALSFVWIAWRVDSAESFVVDSSGSTRPQYQLPGTVPFNGSLLLVQAPRAGRHCGVLPTHYYHFIIDFVVPASPHLIGADECNCNADVFVFVPDRCRLAALPAQRWLRSLFGRVSFHFVDNNETSALALLRFSLACEPSDSRRLPAAQLAAQFTRATPVMLHAHWQQV